MFIFKFGVNLMLVLLCENILEYLKSSCFIFCWFLVFNLFVGKGIGGFYFLLFVFCVFMVFVFNILIEFMFIDEDIVFRVFK